MKRVILIFLLTGAACLGIIGCQSTPENVIVINKNEGILEEKINQKYEGENTFEIPKHIDEEIYKKEGKYSILIEADINEPEQAATYPVFSIKPDDFSQEETDRVINYFFKNTPLYAEDYTMTKDMIRDRIVQVKAEIQNMTGENSDDLTAAQENLQELEKQYETAPETIEKTEITPELVYNTELGCNVLFARADLRFNKLSSIEVNNRGLFQSMSIRLDQDRIFLSSAMLAGKKAENQQMTIKEAEDKATKVVKDLGIDNMTPVMVETGMTMDQSKQGYIVTFRQSAKGRPVALNTILDYSEKADMAAKWLSDRLRVKLDDEGVSAIEWSYKGKIQEELTSNVKMLSFTEIYDIAKQQLKNKFAWIDTAVNGMNYYQTVHIDRVVMEYACVPEKNKPECYLLIPVWNFYGGIELKIESGQTKEQYNGRTDICILSLNAVDGSAIGSSD